MKLLPSIIGIAACVLCNAPVRAEPLSREDLVQALKQRDEEIAALQARVAALERQQAARTAQASTAQAPGIARPANATSSAVVAASSSAPSQEDDTALQALSRTLVERGGLLLPAGHVELIPSIGYNNRIEQGLALVETPEGIPTVADQRLREDRLRGAIALRVGLPWSSQIEVDVPYEWRRTSRSLGDGTYAVNHGTGIGDVELALSHQLFREKGWRPGVTVGLTWRFDTGRDPFRVPVSSVATGSGSDEFRARITAIKSSDPLVFFATLAYAHDLPVQESFGGVRPGDAIEVDLGTVLALNPDTSMTFGLTQEFRGRTRVDGNPLPGTDAVTSTLDLGLSRVLTRNLLLDLALGVGLTHDAPDYTLQLSLPFRF